MELRKQMRGVQIYLLYYRNKDSFSGERWTLAGTFVEHDRALTRAQRDLVRPENMEIRGSILF